jgi:hypothetical protein
MYSPRLHAPLLLALLSISWIRSPALGAEHGVRWKLIEDEVADYDLPCERLGAAAGLTAKDFDQVFPWSQMKLCKLITRPDGSMKVCYSGEAEFGAATQANVMVEIPKTPHEACGERGPRVALDLGGTAAGLRHRSGLRRGRA